MYLCSNFCSLMRAWKESETSRVEPSNLNRFLFNEASSNKREVLINYINTEPYTQEVNTDILEFSFVYTLEMIVEFLKKDDLIDCLGTKNGILEALIINETLDNRKINFDKVSSIKIQKTLNNDLRVNIKYLNNLNENKNNNK